MKLSEVLNNESTQPLKLSDVLEQEKKGKPLKLSDILSNESVSKPQQPGRIMTADEIFPANTSPKLLEQLSQPQVQNITQPTGISPLSATLQKTQPELYPAGAIDETRKTLPLNDRDIFRHIFPEQIKTVENQEKFMRAINSVPMYLISPLTGLAYQMVQELKNVAVSIGRKEKYNPLEMKQLSELLPETTPQTIKTGFSIGEAIGDVALIGTLRNLANEKVLEGTLKTIGNKLTKAGWGVDKIEIAKENIRDVAQKITPEQAVGSLIKAKMTQVTPTIKPQIEGINIPPSQGTTAMVPAIKPIPKTTATPSEVTPPPPAITPVAEAPAVNKPAVTPGQVEAPVEIPTITSGMPAVAKTNVSFKKGDGFEYYQKESFVNDLLMARDKLLKDNTIHQDIPFLTPQEAEILNPSKFKQRYAPKGLQQGLEKNKDKFLQLGLIEPDTTSELGYKLTPLGETTSIVNRTEERMLGELGTSGEGKITIKIPDDGKFNIENNLGAINQVLNKLKVKSTAGETITTIEKPPVEQPTLGQPVTPQVKQPWEMTLPEYFSQGIERKVSDSRLFHKEQVKQAISDGLLTQANPRYAEIIKDYPELQKPVPETPPSTSELMGKDTKEVNPNYLKGIVDENKIIVKQAEEYRKKPIASTTTPLPAQPPLGQATMPAKQQLLPQELKGAKPRYGYGNKLFELEFASDIDRAAYITAQPNKSKRDGDYLKFVMDNTGKTEVEVRQYGAGIRNRIKEIAKNRADTESPIVISKSVLTQPSEGATISTSELMGKVSKEIETEPVTPGLGIKVIQDEQVLKKQIASVDPDVEDNIRSAKLEPESLGERLKQSATNLKNSFTRTYRDLPNSPETAELRRSLRQYFTSKEVAQFDANNLLRYVTDNIKHSKANTDLFTRKVILDSLQSDVNRGLEIPFGYTPEILAQDLTKINQLVDNNPAVQKSLSRRKEVLDSVKKDLVKYGLMTEEQFQDPHYFHHQVLEYANLKAPRGTGKKLSTPWSGYMRKKVGTTLPINPNYVEAEYEYLAQALKDIKQMQILTDIENSHVNIKPQLMEFAKEKGKNWRDVIPQGYVVWQPKEGRAFYTGYSIADNLAKAVIDNEIGTLLPEDLKKVLMVGKKYKELVLPTNVAKTLDNLYTSKENDPISGIIQNITATWKVNSALFHPRRVLKFWLQNALSDTTVAVMANYTSLKEIPKAIKDLIDFVVYHKELDKDARAFFEEGGLSSGFTLNEIPDMKQLSCYENFYDKQGNPLSIPIAVIQKYWDLAKTSNVFRENVLRLAMYRDYLRRYRTNDFRNPFVIKYGSSVPAEIDALPTSEAKASKIATDTMGNYIETSAAGKELSKGLVPFYRWMEVNYGKRYPQMIKNIVLDSFKDKAVLTPKVVILGTTATVGKLLVWVISGLSLSAVTQVWNHTGKRKEVEEGLSDYDKGRMHLNLGVNKDGSISIIRGQDAVADVMDLFGLNEIPTLAEQLKNGQIGIEDVLLHIPKSVINKLVGSITPLIKTPLEVVSGKTYFPDVFNPAPIKDKIIPIMRMWNLENEYNAVMGYPTKGYGKSWKDVLITTQNPLENAYWDIQNLKRRFKEKLGHGGTNDFHTPRSLAVYYYKKALKLNDKNAIKKYGKKLDELNITKGDLEKSIEAIKPTSGLGLYKTKFLHSLSPLDKKKLEKAQIYYDTVLNARRHYINKQ